MSVIVWKKDMRYNPYLQRFDWYYSELVPKMLTLSEYSISKKGFRHSNRKQKTATK